MSTPLPNVHKMAGIGAVGDPGGPPSPHSRRSLSRPQSAATIRPQSASMEASTIAMLEAELRRKDAQLAMDRLPAESLGVKTSDQLAKELAAVKKRADEAEVGIAIGKRMWAKRDEEVAQLRDNYIEEAAEIQRLKDELLTSRNELSRGKKVYQKFLDDEGRHRQNSSDLSDLLKIFEVSDAEMCKQTAKDTLAENRNLQDRLWKVQTELQSSKQRADTLEGENGKLDLKLRDVAVFVATKEKEMAQIQLKYTEAQKCQAVSAQDAAEAWQTAQSAKQVCQSLHQEVDVLSAELEVKEKENDILKNDERNFEIIKYQEQLNKYREDLSLLKKREQDVQDECATAWADLYDVQKAEQSARERLAVFEREKEDQVQQLKDQVQQLKEELSESKDKLKVKSVELQEMEEQRQQALVSEKKAKDEHMAAEESQTKKQEALESKMAAQESEVLRLTAQEGRLKELESLEIQRQARLTYMSEEPKPDINIDSRACVVS